MEASIIKNSVNNYPVEIKPSQFDEISKMLIEFYTERPDSYGLMNRSDSDYSHYVNFIQNSQKISNKSILDVGTGTYRIVNMLSELNFSQVVGLDYFSQEKLEEYKSQLSSEKSELVSFNSNDTIPFNDNTFDIVSSLCVVEHLVYPEKMFLEMERVLKPGGTLIIHAPNWSSILVPIMAILHILKTGKRLGPYRTIPASIFGIFLCLKWYLRYFLKKQKEFLMILPNIMDSKINFEVADDDAVHYCHPLSLKNYFKSRNFVVQYFNRGSGSTRFTKIFNKLFPNLASTNEIVLRKTT